MTGTQKLLIRCQRAKDRPNISCTSCYFGKDALREKKDVCVCVCVCGGAGWLFGIPVLLKLLRRELEKFKVKRTVLSFFR